MLQFLSSRFLGPIGIVVAIVAILAGMNYARQTQKLNKEIEELKKNPNQAIQDEVKQLVEQVGKLIALPEGENPTVATITDKERLKDSPFFARAENEDKVLIYVNARKAYLFRPSANKVIEVATLNLSPQADQNFAPKVAVRNGTDVAGLTQRIADELKRVLPKSEVVARDNAKSPGVKETLVVDLTGNRRADAQRLAQVIGAKVGNLPEGEAKPTGADFLILIGSDKAVAVTPSPSPSPTAGGSPSPKP